MRFIRVRVDGDIYISIAEEFENARKKEAIYSNLYLSKKTSSL